MPFPALAGHSVRECARVVFLYRFALRGTVPAPAEPGSGFLRSACDHSFVAGIESLLRRRDPDRRHAKRATQKSCRAPEVRELLLQESVPVRSYSPTAARSRSRTPRCHAAE